MFVILPHQPLVVFRHLLVFSLLLHSTFLITISSADMVQSSSPASSSYIHYARRYPPHPLSPSLPTDTQFLASLLERSRAQRDTYDERQKLLSTYKIVSKTQCLLQMRSLDGFVDAKHVTSLDDTQETREGKDAVR
jgi:hypothetical protein